MSFWNSWRLMMNTFTKYFAHTDSKTLFEWTKIFKKEFWQSDKLFWKEFPATQMMFILKKLRQKTSSFRLVIKLNWRMEPRSIFRHANKSRIGINKFWFLLGLIIWVTLKRILMTKFYFLILKIFWIKKIYFSISIETTWMICLKIR